MARYIVTADNHLRSDRPLCRNDLDWMLTQKKQLDFIVNCANEQDANVLIVGDLFDVPRVPPSVVSLFLEAIHNLNNTCYIIAGNHSLPYHKQENVMESSIGILKSIKHDRIVYLDCHEEKNEGRFEHWVEIEDGRCILDHTLTFPTREDIIMGSNATTAYALLDKFPNADLIFTGDMHHEFCIEDDGRYVINPGCMNIQTADMIGYQPVIFFVDTGKRIDVTTQGDKEPVYRVSEVKVGSINLPEFPGSLSRAHLDIKKDRDARIQAFVETIHREGQIGLSFEDNLAKVLEQSDFEERLRDIFMKLKEGLHV